MMPITERLLRKRRQRKTRHAAYMSRHAREPVRRVYHHAADMLAKIDAVGATISITDTTSHDDRSSHRCAAPTLHTLIGLFDDVATATRADEYPV